MSTDKEKASEIVVSQVNRRIENLDKRGPKVTLAKLIEDN